MTRRISRSLLTGTLAVALFYGLLGTEVQCTTAEARPSLDGLQAQIDALSAEVLHVFDRNGMDLGVFAGYDDLHQRVDVFLPGPRAIATFLQSSGEIWPSNTNGSFWFQTPDCTGTMYVEQDLGRLIRTNLGDNSLFLLTGTEAVLTPVAAVSSWPIPEPSVCNANIAPNTSLYLVPSVLVDPETVLGLSLPVPAPLYVGPLPIE